MPAQDQETSERALTGLLLTGGGARAAYQIGVLEAIADIRADCGWRAGPNPFPIITGTSAGALNAAALACGADDFDDTVRGLVTRWKALHAHHVYRSDSLGVLRTGAAWLTLLSLGWLIARWRRLKPRSMLDNRPLHALVGSVVPLMRLPGLIEQGHMHALAITASSYSSGEHLSFFEGVPGLQPWSRSQRYAERARITHAHLLASSAIPFVFPAVPLPVQGRIEYFGDGSMRQSAPIAPAIHLGAQRVLVVGAGRLTEPRLGGLDSATPTYPTLAQIAGHTMSNIFLDALAVDVERVRRINHTLSLIPPELRGQSELRPIDLLVIAPSQRLDAIAAEHIDKLPPAVRSLLGGIGVSARRRDVKGAAFASYLLFEPEYIHALIALGRTDALAQRGHIVRFFGWSDPKAPSHETAAGGVERRKDPLRVARV